MYDYLVAEVIKFFFFDFSSFKSVIKTSVNVLITVYTTLKTGIERLPFWGEKEWEEYWVSLFKYW